jgi:hypothetical protein
MFRTPPRHGLQGSGTLAGIVVKTVVKSEFARAGADAALAPAVSLGEQVAFWFRTSEPRVRVTFLHRGIQAGILRGKTAPRSLAYTYAPPHP